MILLDTDVMIDVLRGFAPAIEWLESSTEQELGLHGLVVMELLQGCENRVNQRKLEKLLLGFKIYWATEADCNRALRSFFPII